jgi:hypothetical protein
VNPRLDEPFDPLAHDGESIRLPSRLKGVGKFANIPPILFMAIS